MSSIIELHRNLMNLKMDFWLKHELFTSTWWFLLISAILPWLIWWKIVDKKISPI